MTRIPQGSWQQPNTSDKLGSVWASKNLNFDEFGYVKLSPRAVQVFSEDDNEDFGIPLAIGQYDAGRFQIATGSNANFTAAITSGELDIVEDSGSNEPTLTPSSSARFFQNRWWAATADAIVSKASNDDANDNWSTSGETSLTSGQRHFLDVFASRVSLTVSNGNVLKQYTATGASLTNTTNLTIPTDFEIVKTAYNNGRMGIITRTGSSTTGQVKEALFYLWDGAGTSAKGWGVGSDACMDIVPYKSSFAILTRAGQWKYFNGGGFQDMASLPFFTDDKLWSDANPTYPVGDSAVVDGDVSLLNLGLSLNQFGRGQFRQTPNAPSGIWCHDPAVGLYHRWSPSISKLSLIHIESSGTNIGSDVLTAAAGDIPETGGLVRYVRYGSSAIGGLELYRDYFVIKLSSSTFALAETKGEALEGVKIDLTEIDAGDSYFYGFNLIDYGATYASKTGAIALFADASSYYRDALFGGSYYDADLVEKDALCMVVPFLENRGWLITPRIFSEAPQEQIGALGIKFRPLQEGDAIVVKGRSRAVAGLPISAPGLGGSDYLTWASENECWTDTDLSAAKAFLEAGGELELELVAGAGAGQCVRIGSISKDGGRYGVVAEEDVLGAVAGRKSYFIIDNWSVLRTITREDEGYVETSDLGAATWVQYKIELRGVDTCIEELKVNSTPYQLPPTL